MLISFLSAASVALINPWAQSGEGIWVFPKLIPFFILGILSGFRGRRRFSRSTLVFWGVFLAWGLFCTGRSLFPTRSFWGDPLMWDGWVYWVCIAGFCLFNQRTDDGDAQVRGLIWGGVLTAVVLVLQTFNHVLGWIQSLGLPDTYLEKLLLGLLWDEQSPQSPIALFSHRGHAGIVLALTALLIVVHRRFTNHLSRIGFAVVVLALIFCQTRIPLIAWGMGMVWLWFRLRQREILHWVVLGTLVAGIGFIGMRWMFTAQGLQLRTPLAYSDVVTNLPPEQMPTQSRSHFWSVAWKGIRQRPLTGWGFNGFAIAYPFVTGCARVEEVSASEFAEKPPTEDARVCEIPTTKAHNIFLDLALSLGFPGLIFYLGGLGYFVFKMPRGWEAMGIAYLIFGLFWYECAQYTHLFWWVFSLNKKDGPG